MKERRGEQKRRRELEAAVELVRREQEERSGRKRPAYEYMVAVVKKAKAKTVRARKSVTQLKRLNNLKKKLLLKERTYAFEDDCEPKQRTMVVGVDAVEEQTQRLERMRLLLDNYVSYSDGSKRLKGINLKYCLDAWRLFQIEMKKEKKSKRQYKQKNHLYIKMLVLSFLLLVSLFLFHKMIVFPYYKKREEIKKMIGGIDFNFLYVVILNAIFKIEDESAPFSYRRIMNQVQPVIVDAYVDSQVTAHVKKWIEMVKIILEEEKIEFVGLCTIE